MTAALSRHVNGVTRLHARGRIDALLIVGSDHSLLTCVPASVPRFIVTWPRRGVNGHDFRSALEVLLTTKCLAVLVADEELADTRPFKIFLKTFRAHRKVFSA